MICWTHVQETGDKKNFNGMFDRALKALTALQQDPETAFDSLLVQGLSGILMGAPLAKALNVPLLVVTRDGERYAGRVSNAHEAGERALFLDDHFGAGNTLSRCCRGLATVSSSTRVVGSFCYNDSERRALLGFVPNTPEHRYHAAMGVPPEPVVKKRKAPLKRVLV